MYAHIQLWSTLFAIKTKSFVIIQYQLIALEREEDHDNSLANLRDLSNHDATGYRYQPYYQSNGVYARKDTNSASAT